MRRIILGSFILIISLWFTPAESQGTGSSKVVGRWNYLARGSTTERVTFPADAGPVWEFTAEPYAGVVLPQSVVEEKLPDQLYIVKFYDADGKLMSEGGYGLLTTMTNRDTNRKLEKARRQHKDSYALYFTRVTTTESGGTSYENVWWPMVLEGGSIVPLVGADWKLGRINE